MKKLLFLSFLIFLVMNVFAQEKSFDLQVGNDTVLLGNYTIVKFTITNTNGDFEAPPFDDFDLISGPNTSSLFSMINGKSKQQTSYTYYLKPKNVGDAFIDSAYLYSDSDTLETKPFSIIVLPNPDGNKIDPKLPHEEQFELFSPGDDFNSLPKKKKIYKKKKKKLKTRKI